MVLFRSWARWACLVAWSTSSSATVGGKKAQKLFLDTFCPKMYYTILYIFILECTLIFRTFGRVVLVFLYTLRKSTASLQA